MTVLATAGALVLAGCGGGAGEAKKATPSHDRPSAPAPATPPVSAPAPADATNRPKVTLPAGDELIFEPERVGDPVKDAVLADNAAYLRAIEEAIDHQDPASKSVAYYSVGQNRIGDAQWIAGFAKDGTTVTGTTRLFDRQVTLGTDGTARLTYCGDETKGFTKDRRTGRVNVTPPDKDSYVSYVTQLRENTRGVWQTTRVTSVRGDAKCQR
ncbi:hypothetical protein ACFYN0_15175 [Streptomyces sp. NPDC006704]|uniref:hypothetical protein n=1 Tax=Streptomyces sp. NPDC006704 TaxID=3364760 RepID=UPI0036D01B73